MFKNNKFYLSVLTVFFLTVLFAAPVFAQDVTLSITPAGESDAGESIVFEATAAGFENPEYQFAYRRVGGSWTLRDPGPSNTYTRSIPAGFRGGEFQMGVRVREAGGTWSARDTVLHTINPVTPSVSLSVTERVSGTSGTSNVGNILELQATSENVNNPEYRFGWRYGSGSWQTTPITSNPRHTFTPMEPYTGDMDFAVQVREAGGALLDTDRVSHTVIDDRRNTIDGFTANFGYDAIPRTNHAPWTWRPSTLWQGGESSRFSNGRPGEWVSAYPGAAYYRNFDYSVLIQRPFDRTSAQYIVVRAGTEFDSDNKWYPGYFFGYANTGRFTIGARYPDGSGYFTDWTYSNAIKKGGQNDLRVRAVGNTFEFIINGIRHATITDPNSTYTRGRVGITAYAYPGESRNLFGIYRAQLETLSPSFSLQSQESVSPEHKTINLKASEYYNEDTSFMKGDFNY